MNICLIGDNITSLTLAKNLVNKNIKVFVYHNRKNNYQYQSRIIGISKNNLDFFNNNILKIKKNLIWKINGIDVFYNKIDNDKIFNFNKSGDTIFSTIKNADLYRILNENLKKNILFKKIFIKKKNFYEKVIKENKYQLIINCESNNEILKKYFYNKIIKDYESYAYTTIIKHNYLNNLRAIQIFTEIGPIAFLPISNYATSIVYSITKDKFDFSDDDIKNLIKKYNKYYVIKSFNKVEKFKLNFSILRNYYNKSILSFGDSIHRIHPLAGQGFNMTLRDTKVLSKIIQDRIELGLELDFGVYEEFEKKTKHLNYIFATGVDFIHEFFKFDNKSKKKYFNPILKLIGKNKYFNEIAKKYADQGLMF